MKTPTGHHRVRLAPYLFIAPNILVVLTFAFYPLVYNLVLELPGLEPGRLAVHRAG